MEINDRDNDDVVVEFDQTNGKAQGLDGDDSGSSDDDAFGTLNANNRGGGIINEAMASINETLGHPDPEDGGDTAEDRDPAVTEYSEDEER